MSANAKRICIGIPNLKEKFHIRQHTFNTNYTNSYKGLSNLTGRQFQLGSFTPGFISIYNKYLATERKKKKINLQVILDNFQYEKIQGMSQKELIREEFTEEIKECKESFGNQNKNLDKDKNNKNKKKREKVKNIRENVLESLSNYKFNKNSDIERLKSISISKMFKVAKRKSENKIPPLTERNEYSSKNSFNFLDLKENDKNNKKYKTFGNKFINKIKFNKEKIRTSCDFIMRESQKSIIEGKKAINKFNYSWDKYKNLRKFKYPENKLDFLDN